MNRLAGKLPLIAFVFAAFAAVAFTSPKQEGTLKAFIDNEWEVISESTPHLCDEEVTTTCVARFDENDQMIPNSDEPGEYQPL